MRPLTSAGDISFTVKNTFLEFQREQDSLSLLSACGSESERAATEPTPARRKLFCDSDSYVESESTDSNEAVKGLHLTQTKITKAAATCRYCDGIAACRFCDEPRSSMQLDARHRRKRGTGLRRPQGLAEDTDADGLALPTRQELAEAMQKISKAAAHYRVPIQAAELGLLSKEKAIHVTFQPGVIGFDVEEGIVVRVSEEGQARREGVKVGWRIKAVDGQACESFFDEHFENAKMGNKPYRVTFSKALATEKEIEDDVKNWPSAYVSSNLGDSTLSSSNESSVVTSVSSRCSQKDDFMKLWYCRDEPHLAGSTTPIVLLTGFFTHLRAQVNVAPGDSLEWTKHVKFGVEPQLPEGLCLNEATGGVSGIPVKVQETASTHYITANIHAFAPGGIPIGMVTLASCNFVVRILDSQSYLICWTEETTDGLALTLKTNDTTF